MTTQSVVAWQAPGGVFKSLLPPAIIETFSSSSPNLPFRFPRRSSSPWEKAERLHCTSWCGLSSGRLPAFQVEQSFVCYFFFIMFITLCDDMRKMLLVRQPNPVVSSMVIGRRLVSPDSHFLDVYHLQM